MKNKQKEWHPATKKKIFLKKLMVSQDRRPESYDSKKARCSYIFLEEFLINNSKWIGRN
jgi:hypothetical protein